MRRKGVLDEHLPTICLKEINYMHAYIHAGELGSQKLSGSLCSSLDLFNLITQIICMSHKSITLPQTEYFFSPIRCWISLLKNILDLRSCTFFSTRSTTPIQNRSWLSLIFHNVPSLYSSSFSSALLIEEKPWFGILTCETNCLRYWVFWSDKQLILHHFFPLFSLGT